MHTINHVILKFIPCSNPEQGRIAMISLNRPDAANAFTGSMVGEISEYLREVAADGSCRLLILQGKGKNFCGGADLGWMKEQGSLSPQENFAAAERLAEMFRLLAEVPCPTIGVAKGAVFGGGVGLIACCDIALAANDSRFCLSEVKVGLLPSVILPYLHNKIPPGQLKRLAFSASVFTAGQAFSYGLVEEVYPADELSERLTAAINQFLTGAPQAQRRFKRLMDSLKTKNWQPMNAEICTAIAEARTGKEGQAGLSAFLQKTAPPWITTLASEWNS